MTFFVCAFIADCIYYTIDWSSIETIKLPYAAGLSTHICLSGYSLKILFQKQLYRKFSYLSAHILLILVLIGMFRGLFAVDGYFGYKGWMLCSQCALSFVMLYAFGNPTTTCSCLRMWNWYVFPVFILFFAWVTEPDYIALQIPIIIYFYILFIGLTTHNKWAVFIILCGLVLTLVSIENRTGVIKAMGSLLMYSTLWLPAAFRKIANFVLHFFFYLLAIVLVILGLTGTFNVFHAFRGDTPSEITVNMSDPSEIDYEIQSELTADTRTFLYEDVIASAIVEDYVLFGRSVGRGNTLLSGAFADAEKLTGNERLMNEVQMLNIFTWMGIVGVIAYSLLYFQASCLGLFYSKNKYVPIIACAIAFHWALAWMEEAAMFKITDLALFLMMGICFSPQFRKMSDQEFRIWFRSCFTPGQDFSPYDILKRIKMYSVIKVFGIKG